MNGLPFFVTVVSIFSVGFCASSCMTASKDDRPFLAALVALNMLFAALNWAISV